MKVLLCHNYYQQEGGEDLSFEDESWLLTSRGHEVVRYTVHNDRIRSMGSIGLAARTIWSREAYRDLRRIIRGHRPDVMHCTNTFPLISPAAYYVARQEGVPVVQALRNYRLMCPGAVLMRDNRPCEDCVGKRFAWPAILHACYRRHRVASAVAASMVTLHDLAGTWTRKIDQFFTLTSFAREKFIAFGLPAERISVKPNFVHPDSGPGQGGGGYAAYVGRLSTEKGIETLLAAWKEMPPPLRLKIVGDGPLRTLVQRACSEHERIVWLGRLSGSQVADVIGRAECLILPSICFETFGRTIAEAYNRGTPVVASRLGAMAELVHDGATGRLFAAGDPADLAAKVQWILDDAQSQRSAMRQRARFEYESKFTAEANYRQLHAIYQQAMNGT